jgi:hypothetical protein
MVYYSPCVTMLLSGLSVLANDCSGLNHGRRCHQQQNIDNMYVIKIDSIDFSINGLHDVSLSSIHVGVAKVKVSVCVCLWGDNSKAILVAKPAAGRRQLQYSPRPCTER